MKALSVVLTVASASIRNAFAQTNGHLQCHFQATCYNGAFEISLDTLDKPCIDEGFTLRLQAGRRSEMLPVPPGTYAPMPRDLTAARSSVCREKGGRPVTAYRAGGDRTMLFMFISRRPSTDNDVVAFLIDNTKLALLDTKILGATKNGDDLAVLPTLGGFRMRIAEKFDTPGIYCDCDAAYGEQWMAITVRDGKIETTEPRF